MTGCCPCRYLTRSDSKNGFTDFSITRDGHRHNEDIYAYLQQLTSQPVPGFGSATFADKYGGGAHDDRDSILMLALDYIRSGNLNDGALSAEAQFCVVCAGAEHIGFGQVTPLVAADPRRTLDPAQLALPKGMGRIVTLSEAAFVFTCIAEVRPDGTVSGASDIAPELRNQLRAPGDRVLEAALVFETFVPGHGWGEYRPYVSLLPGGVRPGALADSDPTLFPTMTLCGQTLQLPDGRPLSMPNRFRQFARSRSELPADWHASGGTVGIRTFSDDPVVFEPIVVKGDVSELTFSGSVGQEGSVLAVSLYDTPESAGGGLRASGDLVQTIVLEAPGFDGLPLPALDDAWGGKRFAERVDDAFDGGALLSPSDVVQSLVPVHGDHRLLAARRVVGPELVPHEGWGRDRFAHALREPEAAAERVILAGARPEPRAPWGTDARGGLVPGLAFAAAAAPDFPQADAEALGSLRRDGSLRGSCAPWETGDFDNGVGLSPDGAYANRPDDGAARGSLPYFRMPAPDGAVIPQPDPDRFSPQRVFPSPVMFGSLPTGVQARVPWQTLLFRPQPDHYGQVEPHDHLLLDNFWMPAVEPRPVSRPFETEGKINLNHPLVPFRHIRRTTALHALFKAEKMMAIPDADSEIYKDPDQLDAGEGYRHFIDTEKTLALWDEEVFGAGRTFLSASEICRMPLVPEGQEDGSRAAMEEFWERHRLTGDNTRERPYAHLYPRLTTRSNTFRMHFVVQAITPGRGTAPGTFDPEDDAVTGELRGSRLICRSLPVDDPELPDYLANPDAQPLESRYRWQVGAISPF